MAWAPDYITTAQLRAAMRIGDAADDTELGTAITAASRAIDRCCNRQFGLVGAAEARYYTAEWNSRSCRWQIPHDDLQTTTGLIVRADLGDDGTYGDLIDEYALLEVNAAQKGKPWTAIEVHPTSAVQPNGRRAGVEIVGRWGWTTVPTTIVNATKLQASRFAVRRDSVYGIAGSPDMGSELRLLDRVDPDVAVMIKYYVRWWAAR